MSHHTASRLSWVVFTLTLALAGLGCVLLLLNRGSTDYFDEYILGFLPFSLVGAVVASRRSYNPIGWLLSVVGLSGAAWFCTLGYVVYTLVTRPGALPGAAWLAWSGIFWVSAAWIALLYALLLFPTGHLPSPRWRFLAWSFGGFVGAALLFEVLRPGAIAAMPVPVTNPTGVEGAVGAIRIFDTILPVISFPLLLGMLASVFVRFHGARGDERQQLKWLAFIASILATSVVLGLLDTLLLDGQLGRTYLDALAILGVGAIPVAVGVAVLKYRLYDIDLIIRRTLTYAALTGTMAVVYFGGVALLQSLSQVITGGGREQPQWAIVASTLAIAALFQPLRRRIQRFIDRRFYRRKYDAARTLEEFGTRLRDEVELDGLTQDLIGVVQETLQPAHVSLWLRESPREGRRAPGGAS